MAEPFVYTPIRTRILRTVEVLGEPTTLDVAEKAMTPSAEALQHLNALADNGTLERRGRRWVVATTTEMVAPTVIPPTDEDGRLEHEETSVVGCVMALIVLALVLGVWMGSCVSEVPR